LDSRFSGGPGPDAEGGDPLTSADLARLYVELARPLERCVGAAVRAPRPVIEDACQFAWGQLVGHRLRVQPEAVAGWLTTTAVREALRTVRAAKRDVSLEAEYELRGDWLAAPSAHEPDELIERRERLARVRELPARQQRIVWLKALGLSRVEMATHERCTSRTVQRQLGRARDRLRLAADAA